MKIRNFEKPQRGAYPGVQDAIFRALQPLSDQVETLTKALQGRLGSSNIHEEVRDIPLGHDQSTEVTLRQVRGVPIFVFVGYTEEYSPHTFTWAPVDQDKIKVTIKWDSAPAELKTVRLVIRGRD